MENTERIEFANVTKKEKATHNGVDTSKWGNDCPRIEVPKSWENHQHTQQLIRKYIDNDCFFVVFKHKMAFFFITESEQKIFDKNKNVKNIYTFDVFNKTFLGFCIEIHIRETFGKSGSFKGSMIINNVVENSNNGFVDKIRFLNCSDDYQKIYIEDKVYDRDVFCSKIPNIKNLSSMGIEGINHWLQNE